MALLTFANGYFEITALTFTPKVIAMGEKVNVSVTIKNISGKSISTGYVSMSGTYSSTNGSNGLGYTSTVFLHGGPTYDFVSMPWAANASKTFETEYTFAKGSYAVDESSYPMDPSKTKLSISIITNATFGNGGNSDYIRSFCGDNGEYLTVLPKRDNPKLSLDIRRTPDDEAATVATGIKLSADTDLAALTAHGYTATLYHSCDRNPATESDTQLPLSTTLAEMYAGITDSLTAVSTTFANGSDWYFLLKVSNGYETQVAESSIPRAFANMHLSGLPTGGVCFGGFSTSVQGAPKLESYYKMYPYGGIDGYAIFPGESFTFQSGEHFADGYLSGSSKELHFTIRLGIPLVGVTDVTMSGTIVARGAKGYLTQASYSAPMDVQSTSFTQTIQVTNAKLGIIRVMILRSTAYGNCTNGTPFSIASGTTPFTISFT